MASLSHWSLYRSMHRRQIRGLASAFIGEIAAILRDFETHDIAAAIERASAATDGRCALPAMKLPPFTIYTSEATRLDQLPLPTPREIAYFYAQIASVQNDLTSLASGDSLESACDRRTEALGHTLSQLREALALGDDILRDLRVLVEAR